jgi:acetyltransferase-like isoleucine patch superfamily enzyme
MGEGVRIFHGVELMYGYKLRIDDGAVIRQGVLLHDRGGITIGKDAVIGSYARIYSHRYSPDDYDQVTLAETVIGAGARIGSHAAVQGGARIGEREVVGDFPAIRN